MIEFAIGAVVLSLVAGALGFTGLARTAGGIAKVLFVILLVFGLLLLLLIWLGVSLVA